VLVVIKKQKISALSYFLASPSCLAFDSRSPCSGGGGSSAILLNGVVAAFATGGPGGALTLTGINGGGGGKSDRGEQQI
jgi:hypothetical protein